MTRWLRSLGARCAGHPLAVIAAWLTVAVSLTVTSLTLGGHYSHSSTLPGTEVQAADEVLFAHLQAAANESAAVVVQAATPAAADAAVEVVVRAVDRLPHVLATPHPVVRWSGDHRTALMPVV